MFHLANLVLSKHLGSDVVNIDHSPRGFRLRGFEDQTFFRGTNQRVEYRDLLSAEIDLIPVKAQALAPSEAGVSDQV